MSRFAKRLGIISLAIIGIGTAVVAAGPQAKSGVPSSQPHPIKPHLIATQGPLAPTQSQINSELATETPIGPGVLYVQAYPTDQQQNAPRQHGQLVNPGLPQRPQIPTAVRPHFGKQNVQHNIVSSGSANLTGINPWWTFQKGIVPGVGSYLANITTGNLLVQAGDMSTPHKGVGLGFLRTYNSYSQHDYANTDGSVPSNYGDGWTNSFDAHIAFNNLSNNQGISVFDSDGARYDYSYVCNSACKYVAPAGQFATLTQVGTTTLFFSWTKKDGTVYWFNGPNAGSSGVAGRLTEIVGRNSNTFLKFAYYFDAGFSDYTHLNEIRIVPEWAGSPGTATNYVDLKFASFSSNNASHNRLLATLTWIDMSTIVTYHYDSSSRPIQIDEPSNTSIPTASILQWNQYVTGTHLIQGIYGGRYIYTHNTLGGWLQFNYSGSAVTSIQSAGHINPTVTDDSGTNPIQTSISGSYGDDPLAPYRTLVFVNSTVSPVPTPFPTPTSPPTGGAACTTSSATIVYDSDGHESWYCFDSTSRVVQTDYSTGAVWLTTSQTWDSSNDITSTKDPRNMENDFAYDTNGNLIAAARPAPSGSPRATAYITYDSHNNVVAVCDPVWSHANNLDWTATPGPTYTPCPANAVNSPSSPGPTLYSYTSPPAAPFGELSKVTSAMGYSTNITYETGPQGGSVDFGLPATIVASPIPQLDGTSITHQTQFYYDQYGNAICSVVRGGIDSSSIYNTSINIYTGSDALLGRVTQHGDPDDASLSNGNVNGACPKTPGISGSTITTTYTYFTNGQIATKQSPAERAAGVSTQFSYDPDGNLINSTTHFGGTVPATTAHYYDADDKLVEVVKPGGWDTRYDYDLSQNSTNTNPVSLVGVTTAIKAHGALFKVQEYHSGPGWIDMKGAAYDAFGRSVDDYSYAPNVNCTVSNLATCESASTAANVYDATAGPGLLDTTTDAVGVVTTYRYDFLGRVTSVGFSDGTHGTAPLYDLDNRVASLQETCASGCSTFIESYTYDRDGNQIQKTERPESNSAPSVFTYQYYPDGMRKSISLSGSITQSNLFTYDYDASGRPKNSNMTFNSTTENFGFTQTRAGRPSSEVDPYSTTTASYDTAAGRLQALTTPEGATSFGSYDPEGEVLAFTEPSSITAVSQSFDAIGEMAAQTPPGQDPNGCALGFTAVGSQGYMTTSASSWEPDPGECIPVSVTGTEDVRNAVQVTEPIQTLNKKYQLFGNDAFDADGRLTLGYNANVCCGQSQAQFYHAYDAESRLLNQKDVSGNIQMKHIYGPDGQIAQIGTEDVNHVMHLETLHWDGNTILFTTNDAGQTDDVKIGITADYFPLDPSPNAKLTIWDRDYTGHMRGCHNGGGHSSWSQLDPYNANDNPLPPISGCAIPAMYGGPIGQGGAILQPDGDGYWDGFVMIQGVRDYDSTLRAWLEPDPSPGSDWNPMTQKAYSWNNNNPSSFQDPSGARALDGDEASYDPSQEWLGGLIDPGFGAGGVDANGVPFAIDFASHEPAWDNVLNGLQWVSDAATKGVENVGNTVTGFGHWVLAYTSYVTTSAYLPIYPSIGRCCVGVVGSLSLTRSGKLWISGGFGAGFGGADIVAGHILNNSPDGEDANAFISKWTAGVVGGGGSSPTSGFLYSPGAVWGQNVAPEIGYGSVGISGTATYAGPSFQTPFGWGQ